MVSHLLFADDRLLFFKANRESADQVKDVLHIYCQASGQRINMDKSSIHFAKGVSESTREVVMNALQVHNVALSEKYLGMPSDVGVLTNGAFKYLKDGVEASSGLARTNPFFWRQRSPHQVCGASCSYFLDVLFQTSSGIMPAH